MLKNPVPSPVKKVPDARLRPELPSSLSLRVDDSRTAREKPMGTSILTSTLERARSEREQFPHRSNATIITACL